MRKTEKKTRKGNRFKLSGFVLLVLRGRNCVRLPREGERRGERERDKEDERERDDDDKR